MNLNPLQLAALGQELEKWKAKAAEVDKLRLRFQTASAETHVKYSETLNALQEKNKKLESVVASLTLLMGAGRQVNLAELFKTAEQGSENLGQSQDMSQSIRQPPNMSNLQQSQESMGFELPPQQELLRSTSNNIKEAANRDERDL